MFVFIMLIPITTFIMYKICTRIPDHGPIGYRKPESVLGRWDGAYVAVSRKGIITVAYFDDNFDYIGNPKKWRNVEKQMERLEDKGWIKMTNDDINLTTGL